MMKQWGFDPASITVPVAVWFGDRDLMVPRTHGEWLAKNLPTASRHFFPGDGHVTLFVNHLDELSAAFEGSRMRKRTATVARDRGGPSCA